MDIVIALGTGSRWMDNELRYALRSIEKHLKGHTGRILLIGQRPKWVNKVHERLDGFKMYTAMPDVEYFALYHPKTIERQENQNQLYDTL